MTSAFRASPHDREILRLALPALGALIAESLKQNANAQLDVSSEPESGTTVTIMFKRSAAVAPK